MIKIKENMCLREQVTYNKDEDKRFNYFKVVKVVDTGKREHYDDWNEEVHEIDFVNLHVVKVTSNSVSVDTKEFTSFDDLVEVDAKEFNSAFGRTISLLGMLSY